MVWVLVVAAWLLQASATARVAAGRGHDRAVWFALGLVFPVAALVAVLLGHPRSGGGPGRLSTPVAEALHESRVAALLAAEGPMTPAEVEDATGLSHEMVDSELGSLKVLGLLRRAGQGRWELSPAAAAALAGDPPPGR